MIAGLIALHQNCSERPDTTKLNSRNSPNGLNLMFRWSVMYVDTGTNVISLDGDCEVPGFNANRITWRAVGSGGTKSGAASNACDTVSNTFFMNIDLSGMNNPEGSQVFVTATLVG